MKSFRIVALLLVAAAIGSALPARANDSQACYSVDAKRGWQYIQLTGSFSRVESIRGSWTVDVINYDRVGARGYNADTEYMGYKYDETIPLGALLIGVPGAPYSWLDQPQALTQPVTNIALRINDDDLALGNNLGALRVCFSN